MVVIRKLHEAELMKTRGRSSDSSKDLPNRQAATSTNEKILLDCMIGMSLILSLRSYELSSLSMLS